MSRPQQKRMAVLLSVFRMIVAVILCNGVYVGHQLALPNQSIGVMTIIPFFKYITFVALIMDIFYFLLIGIIRKVCGEITRAYCYCFCFVYSMLVFVLFWLAYASNRSMIDTNPDFPGATMSFHHTTHTVGIVALTIEGIFYKPVQISFERFRWMGTLLLTTYLLYLEYYIESKGISPYPGLTELTKGQRCLLYGFVWLLFTLSYYTCRQYVRFLGRKEPDHNLAAGDGYAKSSDVSDRKKAH
ncbi:unnamed protein product [Calicophoron daubneyi]|uniref:Uncharacterized protein n=1 Tax=Calicophoron daubneyi TaxID=300641 RepID=A0AAV2T7Y4_CALDB